MARPKVRELADVFECAGLLNGEVLKQMFDAKIERLKRKTRRRWMKMRDG